MMAAFKIFGILPILCLTFAAGWNHRPLSRADGSNAFWCPSEGFHPDPNDCRVFYRCVDWNSNVFFRDYNEPSLTAFPFTCGEGTVFDPEFNVCNHASQTSRRECRGLGGNAGDGTNNQYPFTYPSMASGEESHPTESVYPGYPMQEVITNYPENYPNMNENQISPDGEMMEASPGECLGEGFFPVPESCNKFMRCTGDGMGGYRKFVFRCGEGTVWDQQNLVCNHPSAVPGCGGNQSSSGQYPDQGGYPENGKPMGYPQVGNPGDNIQGSRPDEPGYPQGYYPQQGGYPDQEGGNQQNQNVYPVMQGNQGYDPQNMRPPFENQGYPQKPENRPDQSGYPSQQGYPEQPNQGYPTPGNLPPEQNQGYPQQQGNRPPSNTETPGYNPNQPEYAPQGYPGQQNQGNRPNQSGYPSQGSYPGQSVPQNRPINEGFGQNYPQPGGYPDQGYPQGGSPEVNPVRAPMDSSSTCQNDGFFGVPGDCMKFYRCVDNGKGGYFRFDFTCGPNTVWDQEHTTCNHPWAVQRNDCSNSTMNGSSPDTQQPVTNQNQQLSQNQNQMSTQTTPISKYPSNQLSSSTTPRQEPSQSSSGSSVQQPTTPISKYPSNQLSSSTTPRQEPSQSSSGSSAQQTTTLGPENQTPEMENQSTTEEYQDGSTTPNNQPDTPAGSRPCQPNKNQTIKCEKSGFYPVPGNCKKFYRCVDWDGDKNERFSVYYFECGEGTIWDPSLQTCNHEESVYPPRDCNDGQNQSITSPTTTTSSSTMENSTTESVESTTSNETDMTTRGETTTSAESTPQSTESMTTLEMTTEREETTSEQADGTTESSSNKPTEPSDNLTTEIGDSNPTEPNDKNTTEEDNNNNNTTEPDDNTTTEQDSNKPTDATTDEDNNGTTEPEGGENNPDCPTLEEGQVAFVCPTGFRRHPKDCNLFYQCTISKSGDVNIMTFTCKNDSIYDERKIQCLPPDETDPCPSKPNSKRRFTRRVEPEMASVVPIASSESLCPREGHFPYGGDCHMFFKCKRDDKGRMQGYLYQCQAKHIFSPKSGRCENPSITTRKCSRAIQSLTSTNLKWMTSKVPIEYFDVR